MPATKSKKATWPIVPLASEVKFLSGGTPTMSEPKYWNGDIPWVSSGEMNQRKIHDTSQRVTEDGANEGSKRVPARTVLAVVRGMSLAKEFRVAITARDVTFNQDLKALIPTDRLFPEFLFYYLLSQNQPIRDSASESAHGTKKLDTQVLEEWPLPLPSVQTQRKIAAVLSAYDELMENNRRRIALLEKLAEELYREWFVRLRFPGHEKVKRTKGIPDGWEVKKLGELVQTQYGYTASSEAEGLGPKFLRITDIVPSAIDWESVPHCKIDENLEEKYLLHEGDVVVARTGATVGYAKRINKFHPKAIFASYLVRLIPNRHVDAIFLGLSVERSAFKDFIAMYVTGAAQPQANATTMALFPVLHPPDPVLSEFNQIAQPILDQKEVLLNQMAMLAKTRDLLLPRLISGKLSVEDLDIQFPPGMAME